MKRFKWNVLFALPLAFSSASLASCSASDGWVRYGDEYDSPEFVVNIEREVTITKKINKDFVDFQPWFFVVFETKPGAEAIDIDDSQSISVEIGKNIVEDYAYLDGALLFDPEPFSILLKSHLSSNLILKFHLKNGAHVPEKAKATFWSPRP